MVPNLLDEMPRKQERSEIQQVPVLGIAWVEPWQLWGATAGVSGH